MHPLTFMFCNQNCAFSRRKSCRFPTGKSTVLIVKISQLNPISLNTALHLHVKSRKRKTSCFTTSKKFPTMTTKSSKKSFFQKKQWRSKSRLHHQQPLKQAQNACFNGRLWCDRTHAFKRKFGKSVDHCRQFKKSRVKNTQ